MHNRVKTRTSAEEQEKKKKEKEKKSKLYRAGINKIFAKRQAREYDEEILELSRQILTANPDVTTLWNIRREVLLHLKNERTEDEMQQKMQVELCMVEQCLRANPKSYGGWHHRMWVLDNMTSANWQQELALCNRYLELDERNFHCWNYRRFVVERSHISNVEEFEYSTKKIFTNFSNYSSWHYRSRLLPFVYPDPTGKLPIEENKHKEELELVQNAAFTDPNDQSAWFYQRWLLGRALQPLVMSQVHVTHNMACVSLTQSISVSNNNNNNNGMQLVLSVDGENKPTVWKSTNNQQYSHVWICSASGDLFANGSQPAVTVSLCNGDSVVQSMSLKAVESGRFSAGVTPQFSAGFSEGITTVLQDELDSCMQLLDLEPDNKWTLLTSVLLMQAIDRQKYQEETFDTLSHLEQVDPHRKGYYKDLRSRYSMEYAIDSCANLDQDIKLSHLNLTALYHCQYLSRVHTVDLSNNSLSSSSLPQLHPLQCCQVLKLDNNGLTTLRGFPALLSLQTLSLQGNLIMVAEEIKFLETCTNLVSFSMCDNPVQNDKTIGQLVQTLLPAVKELKINSS